MSVQEKKSVLGRDKTNYQLTQNSLLFVMAWRFPLALLSLSFPLSLFSIRLLSRNQTGTLFFIFFILLDDGCGGRDGEVESG